MDESMETRYGVLLAAAGWHDVRLLASSGLNRASAVATSRPWGAVTSMTSERILWRRLDTLGHDACRLVDQGGAWRIEGASIFRHETGPAALVYEVECD